MSFTTISSNENVTVHVGDYDFKNSNCEKLFGIKLDWKLNFDDHISDACKKASEKLNASARTAPFVYSWCHSRTNNSKINRLHKRYLSIIYNDKQPLLSELLEKDGSVSIHLRNIQSLAIKMFHILPPIICCLLSVQPETNFLILKTIGKASILRMRNCFISRI